MGHARGTHANDESFEELDLLALEQAEVDHSVVFDPLKRTNALAEVLREGHEGQVSTPSLSATSGRGCASKRGPTEKSRTAPSPTRCRRTHGPRRRRRGRSAGRGCWRGGKGTPRGRGGRARASRRARRFLRRSRLRCP